MVPDPEAAEVVVGHKVQGHMQTVEAAQPPDNRQHRSEKEAEFSGIKRHIGSSLEVRRPTTLHAVSQTFPPESKGFAVFTAAEICVPEDTVCQQ
jgi:hypothetical protein